jgi:uncharacterized protein with GYD domain
VREVTLAPAARQLAEPVEDGLELYYRTFGQYDGAAIASLPDLQAAHLQGTLGPTGR